MMQAALHLTAAALLVVVLGDGSPVTLVVGLVLALAPDLDTPKSLIGALLTGLSVPLERRVGHRTATHSLLALALVASLAALLAPRSWLALTAAYGSHLVLDLLIGVQGVLLLWPGGEFLTLTGWRDNGPAARILVCLLLPATLLAALWPQLAPVWGPPLHAVAAAANPLAHATPSPQPTARPSIRLRVALPAGMGLSALTVRQGDSIREGQVLAHWTLPTLTPWPTPTAPAPLAPPTALPAVLPITSTAQAQAQRAVAEAQAALDALTIAQTGARQALLAAQQRDLAAAQQVLRTAQQQRDQLAPRHERAQVEHQHVARQALQALRDAQAAQQLAHEPAAVQRALERVHGAEATLRTALDALDRLQAEQAIARTQVEAAVTQAQADLDALPEQQRQARATLDADQRAAQILATSRLDRARDQAADADRAREQEVARGAVTATAAATTWQHQATATAQAHQAASTATAQAQPTPPPSTMVSRVAGRVLQISAEEQDGRLVVTLELAP